MRAVKEALAQGHPVACGLRWPKVLKGHELIDVPPPSAVADGHSIALVGYRDDPAANGGAFLFRNSWGPHWGNNGYGSISYAYTRTYANDALWLELGPPNSEVPRERFEAEALPVVASGRCHVLIQDMADWESALWSGGKQLFCAAEKEGFAVLAFEIGKPGRYRLRVLATAAPDFGTIRVALDGKPLPPEFDLYSGRVSPAGSLELGSHDFTAGRHRLRFSSVENARFRRATTSASTPLTSSAIHRADRAIMNILQATKNYEAWLGGRIPLIPADIALKHQRMAESPFPFLRATFYRWVQQWPEICASRLPPRRCSAWATCTSRISAPGAMPRAA